MKQIEEFAQNHVSFGLQGSLMSNRSNNSPSLVDGKHSGLKNSRFLGKAHNN